MISSSITLFILMISLSDFTFAMQKPGPNIPSSQSMSFPIPRKESSTENKKGSLIKRMGRSISALLDKQPKVVEASIPTSSPKRASTDSSDIKKEFQAVFGKPVYTINHKGQPCFVSIEGTSFTRYRVNTLAEFKHDSAYLLRPEVLLFIHQQLAPFGKEIPHVDYHHMTPSQKHTAAQQAYKYIKKFKDSPGFKTPFYVVRLMKNQEVVCVFEQEITQ